jgi:NDP-sugar pyrophosphorylase family protein
MKAMILAAGLGTRLRPLTEDRPKALVEINGRPLLEIVLTRLRKAGVDEAVINAHHYADMLVRYLKTNHNFGMRIDLSREEVLLDTGGGLKRAAHFFLDSGNHPDEPFILHNVDVLSTIDLVRIVQYHQDNQALATLAVQNRQTSRHLLFDERSRLCGRQTKNEEPEIAVPARSLQPLAFSGIHVISPRLLGMMTEDGAFSIIATYLRLAAQGEKILAFRADEYYWRDLGKPADLAQAADDLARNIIAQ